VRGGSGGARAFGALAIFVFVEWFCRYNLPLAVRKLPPIEIIANLAGLILLFLALLLAGRIVGLEKSARLEHAWHRLHSRLSPRLARILLILLLPGAVLHLWQVAGSAAGGEESPASPALQAARTDGAFRPNIVIMLADALRAGHLGAYGYPGGTSPFIDSLAADGLVFERHHSETSWTKPSVASLFTGMHQSEHGVRTAEDLLSAELPTLAEEMTRAGYNTGAFVSNPYLSRLNGFARGFAEYNTELMERGHWSLDLLAGTPVTGWVWRYVRLVESKYVKARAADYNRVFTGWLDKVQEPFFAYVHYMEPHSPYDPPEPFKDGEKSLGRLLSCGPAGLAEIDRGLYNGEIRYFDSSVRELFTEMERRGLLERTVFVFTADHGEEFYEHGGFNHHRTLYEEVVHIPLIFHGPGLLSTGRITCTTHANDLPFTLLRLAGLDSASIRLPGGDLLSGNPGEPRPLFMELYNENRTTWAALQGQDKYIIDNTHGGQSVSEFYDLADDPGERSPRPGDDPEALELDAALTAHIRTGETRNVSSAKIKLDKYLEQLRNLGYVK
jgi:arylsulfatase